MIRKIRHEWLRLIAIGCILLFAILPLLTLAFHITGTDWQYILHDGTFWESVKNSLLYTFISAVITTVLALIAAYLLNTAGFRRKNIPVVLLTLGMLVPTVSVVGSVITVPSSQAWPRAGSSRTTLWPHSTQT